MIIKKTQTASPGEESRATGGSWVPGWWIGKLLIDWGVTHMPEEQ
jgi:hypothetical protein